MKKKKSHLKIYGACALLIAGVGFTAWNIDAATPRATPTYTIYEGTIYPISGTAEQAKKGTPIKAEVVVVEKNKIKFVGTKADAENGAIKFYDDAKVVDLGANVMLPGFFDPHGHFPGSAARLILAPLFPSPIGNVNTIADIQNALLANIKEKTSIVTGEGQISYASGNGYDDTMLDTGKHPTADELSVGGLKDVYVSINHISGHFNVVNNKSLKMITNSTYLKEDFSPAYFGSAVDAKVATGCGIKLITGTPTFYLTIEGKDDYPIGGVQVKAGAKATTVPAEVAANLTGLLIEHGAQVLGSNLQLSNPALGAGMMAHASTEYASRGITTANAGGEIKVGGTFANAQANLLSDKLKIRMVLQPRVYTNITNGAMTAANLDNHIRLGWTGVTDDTIGTVGPIETGDDVTAWDVKAGTTSGVPGTDGSAGAIPKDLAALQASNPEKYKDRLILGTWKFTYDGSIQGYSGYLGPKGYYDVGNNKAWNPKCIDGGSTAGEETKTNNKLFTTKGEHYGLSGSTSNISEERFMKTIADYHEKKQGISLHLNGSWANENIVTAIERAVVAHQDVEDTRHTIIHAQMQELQHIQRFMGNYDAFPIDTFANIKKYTNVWTGANEMKDYAGDSATGKWNDAFSDAAVTIRSNPELMRKQNIISSYFLDHTYYWGERHKNIFMGPGRANNMSPAGWAVALNHTYTLHTDTPIVSINPLLSIENAVHRMSSGYPHAGPNVSAGRALISGTGKDLHGEVQHKATKTATTTTTFHDYDQRINVLQAVRGVTINSAFSSKVEDKLGSIEEGKYADFVILGQDIFTANSSTIAQTPVVATIVNNEVVHGVLPGTTDFIAADVRPSLNTPADATLKIKTTVPADAALPDVAGKIILGARAFEATGLTADYAVFSMQFQGNGDAVSAIGLHKVTSNTTQVPFVYEDDLKVIKSAAGSGKYMITTLVDQNMPLALTDVLQNNVQYIIHYTIKDGAATFDKDGADDGKITDPAMISAHSTPTIGGMPSTGGGDDGDSGGCTVGTTPMYDMMLLVLAALGLIAFRTIKRRNN